jgi:hypothetical protein
MVKALRADLRRIFLIGGNGPIFSWREQRSLLVHDRADQHVRSEYMHDFLGYLPEVSSGAVCCASDTRTEPADELPLFQLSVH